MPHHSKAPQSKHSSSNNQSQGNLQWTWKFQKLSSQMEDHSLEDQSSKNLHTKGVSTHTVFTPSPPIKWAGRQICKNCERNSKQNHSVWSRYKPGLVSPIEQPLLFQRFNHWGSSWTLEITKHSYPHTHTHTAQEEGGGKKRVIRLQTKQELQYNKKAKDFLDLEPSTEALVNCSCSVQTGNQQLYENTWATDHID